MRKIDVVCFDHDATPFATFQSHNRKVVGNENGIFLTYINSRNEKYTAQKWKLLGSTDSGDTFRTVYESVNPTNPAPLETDEYNNLYLVYPDFLNGDSYLMIFRASDGYKNPLVTTIGKSAGGKFSMVYDGMRKLLYYFSNNGTFHIIDPKGNLVHSNQVVKPGEKASFEYPHMSMDENGILHAAWTTDSYGTFHYRSIHYMKSEDGGYAWKRMDGTLLGLPVLSDETGESDRITTDDEFDMNTWLSSFTASDGKIHFIYRANPHKDFKVALDDIYNGKQHYIRYDIAAGKKDHDLSDTCFSGENIKIMGNDGFFAVDRRPGRQAVYYVSKQGTRIACLVSLDNGMTWKDYALSDEVANDTYSIYAIGGCREVTQDGLIIGAFTERCGDFMDIFVKSRAHFIRIAV